MGYSRLGSSEATVTYENTMDDYIAFNRFHLEQSAAARHQLRIFRWSSAVITGLGVFGVLTLLEPDLVTRVVISVLTAATMWALGKPLYLHESIKAAKRLLSEGRDAGVFGRHVIRVSDEGVEETTSVSRTMTDWSGIERVAEAPQHLLMYVGSIQAHIVPKAAFASEAEKEEFLALIRSHLGSTSSSDR